MRSQVDPSSGTRDPTDPPGPVSIIGPSHRSKRVIYMNSSSNPTLYVAILLYESSSLDPSYTPLFEECFVLLRADNDEQARARAEQHSRAHETCFNNAAGQEIHWKL